MSPAFMVAFALVLPHGKAAGLRCRRVSWVEVGSFGLSLVFTGNGLDGVPSAGLRTDAGSGRFLRAGPGGWGPARVPAGQTERSRGPCSRPPAPPRFLYSDEVQIGPETVMTTLYTAKKYAVPALEAHCVEFLKKNLRADNAFMLLTQVRGPGAGAPVPGMGAASGGRGGRGGSQSPLPRSPGGPRAPRASEQPGQLVHGHWLRISRWLRRRLSGLGCGEKGGCLCFSETARLGPWEVSQVAVRAGEPG